MRVRFICRKVREAKDLGERGVGIFWDFLTREFGAIFRGSVRGTWALLGDACNRPINHAVALDPPWFFLLQAFPVDASMYYMQDSGRAMCGERTNQLTADWNLFSCLRLVLGRE